ncbi:hypothetical protein CLAFUR0_09429 [Fulvia fulva]|nr:hypothetical protein CLAFUR0_09429 [Fulvia fulva]
MPYFNPHRAGPFNHLDVDGNNQFYHLHPDLTKYEDDTSREPAYTPSTGRPMYFKKVSNVIADHLKVHSNLDNFNLDIHIEVFDEECNSESFMNPMRWQDGVEVWDVAVACIKIEFERVKQLLSYFDPTYYNEHVRLKQLGDKESDKRAMKWGDLYHTIKALRPHAEKWVEYLKDPGYWLEVMEREEEEGDNREETFMRLPSGGLKR